MAWTGKLTIQRGTSNNPASVVLAAGSAEAQSDTISVNIDATNLSRGEAVVMLEDLIVHIQRGNWPLN
jgi:hypothetical protein